MRFNTFILSLLLCFVFVKNSFASQECVILLHGLARTTLAMSSMAYYFKKADYIVINQEYLTSRKTIQDMAMEDVPSMIKKCQKNKATKINFVTHSIGAIVLRTYLQQHQLSNLGRVVMLAPPNHGTKLVNLLHNNLIFKAMAGPAGQELSTGEKSTPNQLKQSFDYPVGIIAGTFNFNPLLKIFFHEDNDGVVPVSSTRLAGMKDFIVLPVSHPFMTHNKLVIQEAGHFLQYGYFNHRRVDNSTILAKNS